MGRQHLFIAGGCLATSTSWGTSSTPVRTSMIYWEPNFAAGQVVPDVCGSFALRAACNLKCLWPH